MTFLRRARVYYPVVEYPIVDYSIVDYSIVEYPIVERTKMLALSAKIIISRRYEI